MLILTRKIDERLVIGEDIFLSILDVKGNQVRIGIDAPKDVTVHREEIFLKLKEQQAFSGQLSSLDIHLAQAFKNHLNTNSVCQLTH